MSIDFVNILPTAVLFTVQDEKLEVTVRVLETAGYIVKVTTQCVKVSAVGAGMFEVPGVIADKVEALGKNDIQILQCNDSRSTV